MTWDLKYRPMKFADVIGQPGNVRLLKQRLKKGNAFDTSYIFAGFHGSGKTTLGRIHARAMLCLNLNQDDPEPCNQCDNCLGMLEEQPGAFSERDAASQGSVDHIRLIVDELAYMVEKAAKRIYLFDEAHRMSIQSQDALLKPIEDRRLVAMLCTTELEKIRGAIRSRCEEYIIRKVTSEDILVRAKYILTAEEVSYEDKAVLAVIDHANRHVRDVINNLEMLAQLGPITMDLVAEHLHLAVNRLYYQLLLSLDDTQKALDLIDQICEQVGAEDAVQGLAAACLDSFKVGRKISVDHSVDKETAATVYGKYQDHLVKLADWFVEFKYPTKIFLESAIALLSVNGGRHQPPTSPILFVGSIENSVTSAAPELSSVSYAPAAALPTPPAPKIFEIKDTDPTEATELEKKLTQGPMSRQRADKSASQLPTIVKNPSKAMTAGEWKESFALALKKRTP